MTSCVPTLSVFSRQKVPGKYIADFYSAEAQLIIELADLNTMRRMKFKKTQTELLFWKVMALPLFVFLITKSTETSVEFASILMLR